MKSCRVVNNAKVGFYSELPLNANGQTKNNKTDMPEERVQFRAELYDLIT